MDPLVLLPYPRQLIRGAGDYTIQPERRIVLVGDVAGLRGRPALANSPGRPCRRCLGDGRQHAGTGGGGWVVLQLAPDAAAHPQGYTLTIAPTHSYRRRHGCWSLLRDLHADTDHPGAGSPLARAAHQRLARLRGARAMLDISRDKVPQQATLYALIDQLAGWKVNQLQLYTEHTFAYRQHPDVWAAASPLTGDDILALDAFCRARHIELVPNKTPSATWNAG